MQIIQVDIDALKASEYNPRKWDESAIELLKASIKRFGFVNPILVNDAPNRNNIVIGGHFRLYVAKELGYKSVPCVFVTIEDETKERELNLRLNKNTGDWDFSALADFDQELLQASGFTDTELKKIFHIEDFDAEEKQADKLAASVEGDEIKVECPHCDREFTIKINAKEKK